MVKLVLGEKSAQNLGASSLSNATVRHRICNLSLDIKEQVTQEIKSTGLFSIQIDESADVQSCSQLMVLARYVHSADLTEEFLFCDDLESTSKGEDVMEKMNPKGLDWNILCGVCVPTRPLQSLNLD